MLLVHVDIQNVHQRYLYEHVHPRAAEQACNVDAYRTRVESQDVGVLHQRTASLKKLLSDVGRHLRCAAVFSFITFIIFWKAGERFS